MFQLRDQLVSLANSTYQGKFVFGGADNDSQPFAQDPASFTGFDPNIPGSEFLFVYNATAGAQLTRDVQVTDSVTVTVNTPGDQIFENGINALEQIGRSLAGYATADVTTPGDPGNIAYTFPADYTVQTGDIQAGLDLLETARTDDVLPEQIDVAGRLNRLESVSSVLEATRFSAKEVLAGLQEVNMDEAISEFGNAQTALQAAYAITAQLQNLSILNFL